MAVRDEKTCGKCVGMDGKHFKVKEFKISETGPPFHMYCRCMIMPYEGSGKDSDEITEGVGGKVKTNLGNEIDITPSKNHSTTTTNPGLKGTPNSSVDILDDAGNIKTRRWFGSDGTQKRDVDFTNHGNPKKHPEWPHEHGAR